MLRLLLTPPQAHPAMREWLSLHKTAGGDYDNVFFGKVDKEVKATLLLLLLFSSS